MTKTNSIKLTKSGTPYDPEFRIIPTDKANSEFFISNLFAQYLILENRKIEKLELNSNDSNKGSDVFITIDSITKGIQLTRLTLNDLLLKQNFSKRTEINLATQINDKVDIDFEINIHLSPAFESKNRISINRKKAKEALINEIISAINLHKNQLKGYIGFFNVKIKNPEIKKIVDIITIEPIESGMYSTFHGHGNIFINYDIDNISLSNEDINKAVLNIYNRKNKGKADILIISADIYEILYKRKELIEATKQFFRNSSFEQVYLFLFMDRSGLFWKMSKFWRIK